MKRFIGYAMVVGFVLSLFFHFGSYFGLRVGTGPFILMHIGAIAPLFILKDEFNTKKNRNSLTKFWINPYAPNWIDFATKLFIIYALINFLVLFINVSTNPPEQHERLSGEYILLTGVTPPTYLPINPDATYQSDPPIVVLDRLPVRRDYIAQRMVYVEIPESAYAPIPPAILRGFSGHWMIFYLAILSKCLFPPPKQKHDMLFDHA